MSNELSFAVELLQALKADISRQPVILLPHVPHEKLVARELLVAALALHVLRLLQKVEIAENELQLGWRQQVSIQFRLCVINHQRCLNFRLLRWSVRRRLSLGWNLLLRQERLWMACWPNRRWFYLVNVLLMSSGVGAVRKLHVAERAVGWNLRVTSTVAGHFALVVIR